MYQEIGQSGRIRASFWSGVEGSELVMKAIAVDIAGSTGTGLSIPWMLR